jgi:hypothetical protein
MKVLSIDVGIKNLAFCLFEKSLHSTHFVIKKWNVVNIGIGQTEEPKCTSLDKKGTCTQLAKFHKDNQFFCVKHSKKHGFLIPTLECKPSFIAKQKLQKLHEIADKYHIEYDKSTKKAELVSTINSFVDTHFCKQVQSGNTSTSKIDLIQIGKNLKETFNTLFIDDTCIDYVIIENQISPIANRMKTLQGMIVQYFIMSNTQVTHFEFVSAANKLKDFTKKEEKEEKEQKEENQLDKQSNNTSSYTDRKRKGISKCLEIISNESSFKEHIDYFQSHKKKDDLADSFLQGLWFISHHKL